MGRVIKLLVLVAFVGGLLAAGSYAGARMNIGKFLGSPAPPMGDQSVQFKWEGIAELPSRPRGWEFRYSKVEPIGNRAARIFVSPKGKVIGTLPKDLERRIEAWRQAREIK